MENTRWKVLLIALAGMALIAAKDGDDEGGGCSGGSGDGGGESEPETWVASRQFLVLDAGVSAVDASTKNKEGARTQ